MGYPLAIISLLGLSIASMWTQALLIGLLTEYRNMIASDINHPRHGDESYTASYHEVIGGLKGKWWALLSIFVVFFALLGLSVAQIVASSSNLYLLSPTLDTRTYALIMGGVFSSLCFVSSFRDFRLLSLVGVASTLYTAFYLTIEAAIQGPIENVDYTAPTDFYSFFTGFTDLLFIFGGHTAAIEKASEMNNPEKYHVAYYYAVFYCYAITLPTGITGYHTFGSEAAKNGNAFYLFDKSIERNIGVALMVAHEFVAFGLFCGPLFFLWEKLLKIENKSYWLKSFSRLIVVWFVVLVSVAFPFFGVINSVLGAFTTTFGSFIIPALVYNLYFSSDEIIEGKNHKMPFNLKMSTVKIINWIIVVLIVVLGLVCGGISSIKSLIEQVAEFKLFDPCYGCPTPADSVI
jgi:auxin influx carrier (AUX1 LAX family)